MTPLQEFITNKAEETLRDKLWNVAKEFRILVPDTDGGERELSAEYYRSHARANGSSILTTCFGEDFPDGLIHYNAESVARSYVELLILAFDLYVTPDSVEEVRKRQLSIITNNIMEKMESYMKDQQEPETSVTIKGKGIKVHDS